MSPVEMNTFEQLNTKEKRVFCKILCCEILKYAWFAWFRCIQFSEDHPKLYQTVIVVFLLVFDWVDVEVVRWCVFFVRLTI